MKFTIIQNEIILGLYNKYEYIRTYIGTWCFILSNIN